MTSHPFTSLDEEDRAGARREGFLKGLVAGLATSLGIFSGLLFWGVI